MRAAVSLEPQSGRIVAFGPFAFDRSSRLLWKEGVEVSLPPRVLGVLAVLLDRPGEVVAKQELMNAVWRDAFVTETSLAEAISVLRQTLGDDPQRPTYIQTLHRRGYRFIGNGAAALTSAPAAPAGPRLSLVAPWLVALFATLIAGSAVWQYATSTSPPPPRRPVRFAVALPPGIAVNTTGAPLAMSQDGSLLAVSACDRSACGIYLRALSQTELTRVAGTTGGAAPFFSPDGAQLGYFANGRLLTVAIGGGSPLPIAEAAEPLGATWLNGGRIVFARDSDEGLFAVSSSGGGVTVLTRPRNGERGHRWPAAMSDRDAILFTADAVQPYGAALSLRRGAWGRLLDDVAALQAPVPEYVVAQRGTELIAARLTPGAMSIAGLPVPVGRTASTAPAPQFAMSASGTLAIAAAGATSVDVTIDWTGELRRLVPALEPPLPR